MQETAGQLFDANDPENGSIEHAIQHIDIGASHITVQTLGFQLGYDPNTSIILSDLDWVGLSGEIIGIANFSTSGTTGIADFDVSFTAHSVTFDLSDSGWDLGGAGIAQWDLVTSHRIPEPTTLALFCLGLVGLGFTRKKSTSINHHV